VAGLLAAALRRRGFEVGLLDADITGPSIPRIFGVAGAPEAGPEGVRPAESRTGVKVVSINLLLADEDQPVIWRGPLISRAIEQFWRDFAWGRLGYLVVDLPPGTSDAALTVLQSLRLGEIVLVTSPQDLAGMVVRKAASMARRLGVPIAGLVENMSYVVCPRCGARIEAYGPSRAEAAVRGDRGARRLARRLRPRRRRHERLSGRRVPEGRGVAGGPYRDSPSLSVWCVPGENPGEQTVEGT